MYWFYLSLALVDMACAVRFAHVGFAGWAIYSMFISVYCLIMANLYARPQE